MSYIQSEITDWASKKNWRWGSSEHKIFWSQNCTMNVTTLEKVHGLTSFTFCALTKSLSKITFFWRMTFSSETHINNKIRTGDKRFKLSVFPGYFLKSVVNPACKIQNTFPLDGSFKTRAVLTEKTSVNQVFESLNSWIITCRLKWTGDCKLSVCVWLSLSLSVMD